jgi:hypothetical protein
VFSIDTENNRRRRRRALLLASSTRTRLLVILVAIDQDADLVVPICSIPISKSIVVCALVVISTY